MSSFVDRIGGLDEMETKEVESRKSAERVDQMFLGWAQVKGKDVVDRWQELDGSGYLHLQFWKEAEAVEWPNPGSKAQVKYLQKTR